MATCDLANVRNDPQSKLVNMDFEIIPFVVVMKGVIQLFDLL